MFEEIANKCNKISDELSQIAKKLKSGECKADKSVAVNSKRITRMSHIQKGNITDESNEFEKQISDLFKDLFR